MRRTLGLSAQARTPVVGLLVLVVLAGASARPGWLRSLVYAAGVVNFIATDASDRGSNAWAPDVLGPARSRSPLSIQVLTSRSLIVVDPDPNDDGNVADAGIAGRIVLALGANADDVRADDLVTAYGGMGGQGVLPIPLVYNGWVQKLPQTWKNLLTQKQLHPIP